jgi:hypothetical protein
LRRRNSLSKPYLQGSGGKRQLWNASVEIRRKVCCGYVC